MRYCEGSDRGPTCDGGMGVGMIMSNDRGGKSVELIEATGVDTSDTSGAGVSIECIESAEESGS